MRKLAVVLLLGAAVASVPQVALADNISVGDYLVVKDVTTGTYSGNGSVPVGSGGPWWVDEVTSAGGGNDGQNVGDFMTFCLELNETLSLNDTIFKVASIEEYAVKGGIGGATSGRDVLSLETQALYHYFRFGSPSPAFTGAHLQQAFWYFEDEVGSIDTSNPAFIWATQNAATYFDTNSNGYYVRALNIQYLNGTDAQSLLTVRTPDGGGQHWSCLAARCWALPRCVASSKRSLNPFPSKTHGGRDDPAPLFVACVPGEPQEP